MSKSQAIAFFEEISKNKQLAQEVEKVIGGKNSDKAKAKELISLAKEHGFNFTQKEAANAQGSLKKSLSPEEMLEVSGGKGGLKSSFMAMALLAGLGIGGAAMSSMEASAMDGDNHQEIQVPGGQAAEQQEGNAQPGQQQQGADGNQEQHNEAAEQPVEPEQQEAAGNREQPAVYPRGYVPGHAVVPGLDAHIIEAGNVVNSGNGNTEVTGNGGTQIVGDGFTRVVGNGFTRVTGPGRTEVDGNGMVFTAGRGQVDVCRPGTDGGPGNWLVTATAHDPETRRRNVHVHEAYEARIGDATFTGVFGSGHVDIFRPGTTGGPGNWLVTATVPDPETGRRTVRVHEAYQARIEDATFTGVFGSGQVDIFRPGTDGGSRNCLVSAKATNPETRRRNVNVYEAGQVQIDDANGVRINCPCDVTHSAPGGNLRVTGNTMITTEGINHITAGENSHIVSYSSHDVDHQGDGGVRVNPVGDRADILIGAAADDVAVGRDVAIEKANAVAVNGAVSLSVTAVGGGGISISSDATVTHSAQHGLINVTGGAVIDARGANRINAHEDTTVASTSANLLTHDGAGAGIIDGGDIEFLGFTEDRLTRDVTVREANSLTVAPGIATRTQNGTEFTMGATSADTVDSIIENDFEFSTSRVANGLEQIFNSNTTEAQETPVQQRNLNFNNPRLQRMLAWAMERFGLTGQDLIDFVQHFFIQGG